MIISDSHTDFLTAIKTKKEREKFVGQIAKFRPTICLAVFTTGKNITLQKLKNYKKEIEFYNKKYHTHFLFTLEDLSFAKSLFELQEIVKLKPFAVTLTWNGKNQFAGGAHSFGGLTEFGRRAIKLLEENGILIDCAHLNRRSFWQFAKITKFPIFCSHTNINSLHHHSRNLTDKQIKHLVASGGYVGLTLYQKFVSRGTIFAKDLAHQFAKVKQLGGINNVGFGTDFFGIEKRFLPQNIKHYKDLSLIKPELKKLNFKDKEVEKVFHNNFINFCKVFDTKKTK